MGLYPSSSLNNSGVSCLLRLLVFSESVLEVFVSVGFHLYGWAWIVLIVGSGIDCEFG